jgi:pyruvate formate lyase activating enzyme
MSVKTELHPGRWWHPLDDGRIQCDLCPRACKVGEGQRAFCFVRQNVDGEMVLTTYGRSTGFCVDPIEKKPLNHFLPGTAVLSFGTAGCNLGCRFCQNWDISKAREIERLSAIATPEMIADAAVRSGCRSVAFTYNDPVIWAEYAIDTAKACHERGIKTVAVTAGYITQEARGEFYQWMDAANVDLKAFTENFYHKITFSHLQDVLETLRWLKHETNVWFEITNLMIPDENDSADEIKRMVDWIAENLGPEVPLHFTAFHPDYKMLDKKGTPPETLLRARQQAHEAGLKYVYSGNIHDVRSQSTFCPSCHELIIERDWHELGTYRIRDGKCAACGAAIAGHFENTPGTWGRRRLPLRIGS